jgi:hypothetical protein
MFWDCSLELLLQHQMDRSRHFGTRWWRFGARLVNSSERKVTKKLKDPEQ